MQKFELEPIRIEDIDCFDGTEYENLSIEKRTELIENSIKGNHKGRYFKFYLFKLDGETIGLFNVCAQSKNVISIAPEIKKQFRRNGYGTKGLSLALEKAKELGYKNAIATIREDNEASIKLHEKLGFEQVFKYDNKEKTLILFMKLL